MSNERKKKMRENKSSINIDSRKIKILFAPFPLALLFSRLALVDLFLLVIDHIIQWILLQ